VNGCAPVIFERGAMQSANQNFPRVRPIESAERRDFFHGDAKLGGKVSSIFAAYQLTFLIS
jgi:hypothetical protein